MESSPAPKDIPARCQKEKGRDLCLFSSIEYTLEEIEEDDDLKVSSVCDDDAKSNVSTVHEHIVRKYYTNLYALTKWSKMLRDRYRANTLDDDGFCKKMEDGTYILAIPARSGVIEELVLSLNTQDDEIANPKLGSVQWVRHDLDNLLDCMQLANFLTLPHVLRQCCAVIQNAFPAAINATAKGDFCLLQSRTSENEQVWRCKIQFIDTLSRQKAVDRVTNLCQIAQFLEDEAKFAWYHRYHNRYGMFPLRDCIERIVCGILHVDLKLVDTSRKYELFHQYLKVGSYAHSVFFSMAMTLFSKTEDKTMSRPCNQNRRM